MSVISVGAKALRKTYRNVLATSALRLSYRGASCIVCCGVLAVVSSAVPTASPGYDVTSTSYGSYSELSSMDSLLVGLALYEGP